MVLANLGAHNYTVKKGDRVAQLIIEKILDDGGSLQEVDQLQTTKRGNGGFGSTGLAQMNKQSRTCAGLLSQPKKGKLQLQTDTGLLSKSAPVRTSLVNIPKSRLEEADPNSKLAEKKRITQAKNC